MNQFQLAFLALAGVIAVSLHAQPVPVNLDGTDYLVNGIDEDEPRFTAQIEGDSTVHYLPVEKRTCNLILSQITWAAGDEKRTMVAGAGGNR